MIEFGLLNGCKLHTEHHKRIFFLRFPHPRHGSLQIADKLGSLKFA
jgi:hypothetical protein